MSNFFELSKLFAGAAYQIVGGLVVLIFVFLSQGSKKGEHKSDWPELWAVSPRSCGLQLTLGVFDACELQLTLGACDACELFELLVQV